MGMIPKALLLSLLASLSFHEAREVYGLTKLQLPWVAVELVIHAMIVRRMMDFEVPEGLQCIEFFAGTQMSSQVAKAFEELGLTALAFDIDRCLDESMGHGCMIPIYEGIYVMFFHVQSVCVCVCVWGNAKRVGAYMFVVVC